MRFTYVTLFPDMIHTYFHNSIMKHAVQEGIIRYSVIPLFDFSESKKYHQCDDTPYGGGPGMLLKVEPLSRALESINAKKKFCIYPSPTGYPMEQNIAAILAKIGNKKKQDLSIRGNASSIVNQTNLSESSLLEIYTQLNESSVKFKSHFLNQVKVSNHTDLESEIIFICGRYEGIDQRIIDRYVDLELSLGDYILSSGEISSLSITDVIYRLCNKVINKESLEYESFSQNLLEYPQYTRPRIFDGQSVPEVLLSGNHSKIASWRIEQSIQRTSQRRPDLLETNS